MGVVSPTQYGERIRAATIYLNIQQLIPEDRTAQALSDLFGAPLICPASIVAWVRKKGEDLRLVYARVGERVAKVKVRHQGEANAIAPGKRPLSSMSPTIVTKDGKPVIVVGTPGGSRIITAVLRTIINAIDYDMNAQEAADMPRFHQQRLPDLTNLENFALSPDTRKILEGKGHKFGPPQPANHLAVIVIGAPWLTGKPVGTNRFYGANDPRRNSGLAAGY